MSRDYTEITDEQLRALNKRTIEQPSYEQLREQNRVLREALEGYAYCSDGCTCGDGWSHDAANEALTATSQEGQG